jgi:hypothetical protein
MVVRVCHGRLGLCRIGARKGWIGGDSFQLALGNRLWLEHQFIWEPTNHPAGLNSAGKGTMASSHGFRLWAAVSA